MYLRSRWLKSRLWRLLPVRICLLVIFFIIAFELSSSFISYTDKAKKYDEKYFRSFQLQESQQVNYKLFSEIANASKRKLNQSIQRIAHKSLYRVSKNHEVNSKQIKSIISKELASELIKQNRNSIQTSFTQSNESLTDRVFYANRIIHFDLKGAAPKVKFLEEVLRLIKANGATGILLEWEDTFPFDGILSENRNSDAYTVEEVHDLLRTAQSLELDIIPLVQTFGHLEWILKVEKFRKYREEDMFPQVVCLADEEGVSIVLESIQQVVNLHLSYGIKYFHIGADEAFQYGSCEKDLAWMRTTRKEKDHLAANHLAKVAKYVKKLIPGVRVLAWHDMVQSFPAHLVLQYHLDKLLEIVVWDYSETLQQQNEYNWYTLASKFPTVWASSAFKGANKPSSTFLDLKHYLLNNQAWITHRKIYGPLFRNFRGIIITGWQRYDHFAVLCELLPVAVPSVILNLLVAKAGDGPSAAFVLEDATEALNCTKMIAVEDLFSFSSCKFPGVRLFEAIHLLKNYMDEIDTQIFENDQVKGWLSRFNLRYRYSQNWYLVQIEALVKIYAEEMIATTESIKSLMSTIFKKHTVDEWIYEHVDPVTERLIDLSKHIKELKTQRIFAVRNFDIKREVQSSQY